MDKVLIIGNCKSDYVALAGLIEIKFKAKCFPALSIFEAKKALEKSSDFNLILTNRSGYYDHKAGVLILDYLKESSLTIPVFLLSSKEDAIQEAVKKGAKGGFNKDEIYADEEKETIANLLKPYLIKNPKT